MRLRDFFKKVIFRVMAGILYVTLTSCGASRQQLNDALLAGDPNAYRLVNRHNANTVMTTTRYRHDACRYHENWRVIHHAAFTNNKRLADALIENGADLNQVTVKKGNSYNPSGYTPAQLASTYGYGGLSRYLAQNTGENIKGFESAETRRKIVYDGEARRNLKIEQERIARYIKLAEEKRIREASIPKSPMQRVPCPNYNCKNGLILLSAGGQYGTCPTCRGSRYVNSR